MQETRQQILDILRERGEATVDNIVADLEAIRGSITSVTVRHHLSKLQDDGLVDMPQMRHRSTPGRPRHIYTLTEKGSAQFPNNYQSLAGNLLHEIKRNLPDDTVNVIIEGVVDNMVDEAKIPVEGDLPTRLEKVVNYLNTHGYEAEWRTHSDGFVLKTTNCPYHGIEDEDETLCHLDMRLISKMLGVVPRLMARISEGDEACSYLIPKHSIETETQ